MIPEPAPSDRPDLIDEKDVDNEAWSRGLAGRDPQAETAPEPEPPIEEDHYTEEQILDAATFVTGLVAVPGDRVEAFSEAAAQARGKAAYLLEQIQLGKALAEVGIRPSRSLAKLPRWARILGGLGAVAYVIGTAYNVAVNGPAPERNAHASPPSPGRNGAGASGETGAPHVA